MAFLPGQTDLLGLYFPATIRVSTLPHVIFLHAYLQCSSETASEETRHKEEPADKQNTNRCCAHIHHMLAAVEPVCTDS